MNEKPYTFLEYLSIAKIAYFSLGDALTTRSASITSAIAIGCGLRPAVYRGHDGKMWFFISLTLFEGEK